MNNYCDKSVGDFIREYYFDFYNFEQACGLFCQWNIFWSLAYDMAIAYNQF